MRLHRALQILAEDSLLAAMPDEIANRVKTAATVRVVTGGEAVALQGQRADKLIIPVDGPLRLVTRTPTGSTTTQLRARRALNLSEVLTGQVWAYSAFADSNVNVVEVDAAILREVLTAAPSYARYLFRMTTLQSFRAGAAVLRRSGLHPRSVQRLFTLLEARAVPAGDMITERGAAPWLLVDHGAIDILREDGGDLLLTTTIRPSEFYGAGAVMRRSLPFHMRAREESTVFLVEASRLKALCAEDPALDRSLRLEHPDVQRRVRKAFIDSGQAFTDQMLAVSPDALAGEDDTDDVISPPSAGANVARDTAPTLTHAVLDHPRGRPWTPPASIGRRLDGVRCVLAEDSGASALASVLKYYDRTVSYSSVRRALQHRSPPSLLDLAQIAERQGLMTSAAKLAKPADMRKLRAPFLLFVGHHYVVVHEVHRRFVRVFSPTAGLRELTMKELTHGWNGSTLSFRDIQPFMRDVAPAANTPDAAAGPPATAPTQARSKRFAYLKLFTDVRGAMTAAIVVSLAVLGLAVLAPRLNGLIIDQVITFGDSHLLVVVVVGMILIHLSTFALSGFRELALAYLGGLIEHRLSSLSLRHTLGIGLEAHGEDRVGTALARLDDLARIRSSISTDVIQTTLQVAKGVVYLILIAYYSWKLGLLVTTAIPVSFIIVRFGGKRLREQYLAMFDANSQMQSQTTEQVEQVATIKALGGMVASQRRWEKTLVSKLGLERKLLRIQIAISIGLEITEEAIKIGATYLGIRMVLGGDLTPGLLLTVTQYTTGALAPLLSLSSKFEEFAQAAVSLRKLDELFAHPMEDDEAAAVGAETPFEGAITLRNLTFAYGAGPPVLRGISLDIKPGQTIAIVGRSGSGKTTLAKLLHGAVRPTGGDLIFDEQDSRSLTLPAIRRNVGIVLQDSQLFAGTIRDNIAYGDDRPDDTRIREAARLAAAHDFIMAFPARYDTYLAEGGLGLSGGQRQRVCIARALYRSPRVLIMDEATSALDAESERAIMANMPDILHGRTGIVIAHRLTTVKHAHRIIVIDEGEIVEEGSHDELVAKRGLYHSLFDRQFHQV
jgi:ATP-binding cassette, subfamily B, bacterial HlyB/CyaB